MSNSILDSVKDGVTDLHRAGLVDDITLKNIESLCIPEVKKYDAGHIASLRKRLRLSQTAFARFLNISPSTIRQWENGSEDPKRSLSEAVEPCRVDVDHGCTVLSSSVYRHVIKTIKDTTRAYSCFCFALHSP